MVSDQEIARGVELLLLRDPTGFHHNGAVSSVVQQLSDNLGIDLSHKAAFISDQINLLRHHFSRQHIPQSGFGGNDHFALQGHPHQQQQQFLQHCYYQQLQQQQQQRSGLNSPFTLHFGGFHQVPTPPQHVTVATQQPPQQHVTVATQQPPQQHVVTPAPTVKNGAVAVKASKESSQTGTKKRGGCGGLNKLCGVSPELQAIVGEATMARTEIVRQLWVYIRKNNLQDPSNKRKINCDEALRAVLETDCTDMFKMNKLLAKHILPLDPKKDPVPSKRQKLDVEVGSLPAETVEPAETVKTAEPEPVESAEPVETAVSTEPVESAEPVTAFDSIKAVEASEVASPVRISDSLADFLGTTRREMLASEAIQHVFEYVKVNSLEDTSSMTVTCDAKLKELLGCESIPLLEINETVARHHLLQSL